MWTVHDGDYWRLLTPGEYEITVSAEGFLPQSKLIEVDEPRKDEAPVLNFELFPEDLALDEDQNVREFSGTFRSLRTSFLHVSF